MNFYERFDLKNPSVVFHMLHRAAEAHYHIQTLEQKAELSEQDVAMATFGFLRALGFYPGTVNDRKVIEWHLHTNGEAYAAVPVFFDGKVFESGFPICGPDFPLDKLDLDGHQIEEIIGEMLPKAVITFSPHQLNAKDVAWHVSIRESFMQDKDRSEPVLSGTACNSSVEIALMQAAVRLVHAIFVEHYTALMMDVILEDRKEGETDAMCILRRTKQTATGKKLQAAIQSAPADHPVLEALRKAKATGQPQNVSQAFGRRIRNSSAPTPEPIITHDGTKITPDEGAIKKQAFIDECRAHMNSAAWKGVMSIIEMVAKVDEQMARHQFNDALITTRKEMADKYGNTAEVHKEITAMFDIMKRESPILRRLYGIKDPA